MFTIEQIEAAHSKVKSGAEFPKYIQEIKSMGVIAFETWVNDSRTVYFGKNDYKIASQPKNDKLIIENITDKVKFAYSLKIHQQGETNFQTFCKHCAATGIEKWIVDLEKMTCTYYDHSGNSVLIEKIPT
ncbi:MAG: DUF1398 family protein [Bacteroidetes bacterium]|nr:DUF1398 family protein [Bacteroidota bacterium]